MKKKTFLSFFLKRWIPMLLIAILIGGLGTEVIHNYIFETETEFRRDSIESGLIGQQVHLVSPLETLLLHRETLTSASEQEHFENEIAFCLNSYGANVLYDSETNELLYPIEENALLLFGSNSADIKSNFYSCPLSYFEELGLNIEYTSFKEACSYGPYSVDLQDFYIKGTEFRPGTVTLKKFDQKNIDFYTPVKTVDLTPTDTKGYKHYSSEDFFQLLIFADTSKQIAEDTDELIKNNNEFLQYSGLTYDTTDSWMTYDCYETFNFPIGDNFYTLVSYYPLSVWDMGHNQFIYLYTILFFGSILIAAIMALLTYKRYETLRYQRTLTNALAHDLKSPLMVMSGYVENLSANIHPEKQQHYTEGIAQNINHMNNIICNILELSRVQNKKIRSGMTAQAVAPLFQDILKKYDPLIREKKLSLQLSGDTTVKCDTVSLSRAFENLVTNALFYCPEKGTINIQITEKQITISNPYNNEINCKPKELLESFKKGDNSRGESHGSGIGLSIVNSVMQLHKFSFQVAFQNHVFTATINM